MANRDVETVRSRAKFVATLRRVADAIEAKEPVRIQVAGKRISIPVDASLSVEHEVEGREAELELQLKWREVTKKAAPARAPRKRKPAADGG